MPRFLFFTFSLLVILVLSVPPAQAEPPSSHERSLFSELSDDELLQWWQSLSISDRQMLYNRHQIYQSLPQDQQNRLRKRWEHYQDLPPEQRQHLRNQFKRWRSLPVDERQQLRSTFRRFKDLSPEKQEQLRQELAALQTLPESEQNERRQELINKYFPGGAKPYQNKKSGGPKWHNGQQVSPKTAQEN